LKDKFYHEKDHLPLYSCFVRFFLVRAIVVEISRDPNGSKILKGFIAKKELATDTAFAWFVQGQKSFTPMLMW
jgi:hypothetical protein